MPSNFFDQLLDRNKTTGKRKLTLPFSIGLHVVVLAAVIILPLLSWDTLPEPAGTNIYAFFVEPAAAPPPPPPPPPPAPAKALMTPKAKPKVEAPKATPEFTAPVDVPQHIQPEQGSDVGSDAGVPAGAPEGVEGGVEGGVKGGVVGGVVGGVEGGIPEPEATPPPPPPPPPTAPPVPKGPVRVGGQIKEPRKIRNVSPVYPEVAKQARVQGVVVLECVISPSGRVSDVRVVRGIPLLNDAAAEAVRGWSYSPTLLNGVPVPVIMTVTVNFRLSADS